MENYLEKARKIGILTTPLFYNYGGILQCFALQKVLQRVGYQAVVIDIQYANQTLYDRVMGVIKAGIKKYLLGKKDTVLFDSASSAKNRSIISQNITPFIQKNIEPRTPRILGVQNLKALSSEWKTFDAIVVGSDQVWRPAYCDVFTYFLGFLPPSNKIKKISYAASFGVDKWEFSPNQTQIAQNLITDFAAVSVREDSAINLCKKYLHTEATHVLDPTLLLEKDDYLKLIEGSGPIKKQMMVYVLDINKSKENTISSLASQLGLAVEYTNNFATEQPHKSATERIVPPIESWLKSFAQSQFVVTDSFHGMVFSIIFNIPFVVYGNKERGLSRFTSLLKILKLENRLITSENQITDTLIHESIDWDNVNATVKKWKKYSMDFLINNLR